MEVGDENILYLEYGSSYIMYTFVNRCISLKGNFMCVNYISIKLILKINFI